MRIAVAALLALCAPMAAAQGRPERARDMGIALDGTAGPLDAITDVPGVTVGHTTLISGAGRLRVGRGPVAPGSPPSSPAGPPISRRRSPAGSISTATAR